MSLYPSTIYRVSLKAIIHDDEGKVLLVQEGDPVWTFPGGGIEHDESEQEALVRELTEEANIVAPFSFYPIGVEPIYVEERDTWLLWIVYKVTPEPGYSFGPTDDAQKVEFKDPAELKESDNPWERLVYKWAVEES